jgi:exonuclease SbcC
LRPLKLVIENFASYRGALVDLDFTALELFAIAGPTGAGKSTLLDAMFFALYGSVPRLGRRDDLARRRPHVGVVRLPGRR